MEFFKGLEFPYSREVKDLPRHCLPNLIISNANQSLFSLLKNVRAEIIGKKLKNSGYFMFDRFVIDVLGASALKVHSLYPPENEEKLVKLLDALYQSDLDQVGIDAVIYYLLKDFSFDAAEQFICGGTDFQHTDHTTIGLRIPKCLYDLINAIYFIDRFEIFKSLRFLNANDYASLPMSFVSYFTKMANIVPYHSEFKLSTVLDVHDMRAYIESRSCKPSACSVVASVRAFKIPILALDSDTQLLFIDSLSDLNPHSAVCLIEEMDANYDTQLSISHNMLVRLVVIKLLIKTIKQQKALRELESANKLTGSSFDQLFQHLAMFQLVDTKIDAKVTDSLSELVYGIQPKEEAALRAKFPNYYSKLDELKTPVRKTARDLLAWKCALENKPHRLAEIALVNIGVEHGNGLSLKEVASHFY